MQVSHPATHGDKLIALRSNKGLPLGDKKRVELAIERYRDWVAAIKAAHGEGNELLSLLVSLLNKYKTFIDLDLIYDAEDSFLYRQNGQLKLANTVLEEFLPYLFDVRLVPGFGRLTSVVCGPQASFAT